MPKFDMDKLFDYLIVIVIVVGPVLAAVVKKLITFFSPPPPESPSQSIESVPKSRRRMVHPARPPEPVTARPASPPVRVPRPDRPVVARPTPIARRPARGDESAKTVVRRAPLPEVAPMTHEVMVEDHLGHLTSSVEGEARRVGRGVESRLKHVETDVASLKAKRDRPVAQETAAVAPDKSISIRQLTRHGLRRAILLREILGPPVALRAPDEAW